MAKQTLGQKYRQQMFSIEQNLIREFIENTCKKMVKEKSTSICLFVPENLRTRADEIAAVAHSEELKFQFWITHIQTCECRGTSRSNEICNNSSCRVTCTFTF